MSNEQDQTHKVDTMASRPSGYVAGANLLGARAGPQDITRAWTTGRDKPVPYGNSSGSWVTLGTRRAICGSHSRRSDRVHHRPLSSAASPCTDMPFDLANS